MQVSGVYFIQVVPDGPIKIGWARDFRKRLDQIQNGCPADLAVLLVMPSERAFEREMHDMFAAHRVRGEWFLPVQELKTFVMRNQDKGTPYETPARRKPPKLVMGKSDAKKVWDDPDLSKQEKRKRMFGWSYPMAVRQLGQLIHVRRGPNPDVSRANGAKSQGRPLKKNRMAKAPAKKIWHSEDYASDNAALKRMEGWTHGTAWHHFGASGRRKPGRPRKAK